MKNFLVPVMIKTQALFLRFQRCQVPLVWFRIYCLNGLLSIKNSIMLIHGKKNTPLFYADKPLSPGAVSFASSNQNNV